MPKDLFLDVGFGDVRLAVMEDGTLAELYVEAAERKSIVGNIYRGKVERVLPGMQAAFVDIGIAKNAFLYVRDMIPNSYNDFGEPLSLTEKELPPIDTLLKAGQELTVQIIKEQTGEKGPRISTRLTLPGHLVVLLLQSNIVGVSRRIDSQEETQRLKELGQALKPEGAGLIIRTASQDASVQALEEDIKALTLVWENLKNQEQRGSVPRLLYSEADLVTRASREFLNDETNRFIINDQQTYQEIVKSLEAASSGLVSKVELFTKNYELFEYYHVESAILEALSPKVWLKSGAYVVFNYTEALTAVDVNTGRYVGKDDFEETVLKINLEAVETLARQIRLRDISGIIIIDFIDMQIKENREMVVHTLREAVKHDRTQTVVVGMTSLGLVELTRKKVRQPLYKTLTVACKCCKGNGWHLSTDWYAQKLLKKMARYLRDSNLNAVTVQVHPDILKAFNSSSKEALQRLTAFYGCSVQLESSHQLAHDEVLFKV